MPETPDPAPPSANKRKRPTLPKSLVGTPLAEPLNVSTQEAAWITGVPVPTLEKMRHFRDPNSPPWFKANRSVLYPVAGLKAWAAARGASQ